MPKVKTETLPVVYDTVEATPESDGVSVEVLKEMIGWEAESEKGTFGSEYDLEDYDGHHVRLTKNVGNRPLNEGWAYAIAQKLLRNRWRLNGESIIIGRHGNVLSAQHRIVGAVLAEQMRTGPEAKRWAKFHKGPITLPTVIVTGISEDADTVNTLDLVRPRTLSDILYRSHWFANYKAGARQKAAKVLSWAVKTVLKRALGNDKVHDVDYRLSIEEGVGFCEMHPRLVKLVKHVIEEDVQVDGEDGDGNAIKYNAISRWFQPGNMSAFAYLMATSGSDGTAYRRSEILTEKKLDTSNYDKAEEFVTLFADASKSFPDRKPPLWGVLSAIQNLHGFRGGKAPLSEVASVIVEAWKLFAAGEKLDPHKLTLEDCLGKPDELTGARPMVEYPNLGGIDMGEPERKVEEDDDAAGTDAEDDHGGKDEEGGAEPEEATESAAIEARKKEVKKQSLLAKRHSEREGGRIPKPAGGAEQTYGDVLAVVRKHPAAKGRLLLFHVGAFWVAWQGDAELLATHCGVTIGSQHDLPRAQVAGSKLDDAVKALREAGLKPVLVEPEEATGDLLVTVPPA